MALTLRDVNHNLICASLCNNAFAAFNMWLWRLVSIFKLFTSAMFEFLIHQILCVWRWNVMEMEEQWRREKRVVGEKEKAERKIYLLKYTYFEIRDKYEML